MRNIIRIGAGTDRRNRFVAIALGVALAAGPAAMLPAAAGAAPLASTGAGTGPAIAVAGLLAMAGASLLAAVARTRRHGADPDGLTAD